VGRLQRDKLDGNEEKTMEAPFLSFLAKVVNTALCLPNVVGENLDSSQDGVLAKLKNVGKEIILLVAIVLVVFWIIFDPSFRFF
jgi:hypothetical protein